jgi:serine/threonine protein phosphatase PrpC
MPGNVTVSAILRSGSQVAIAHIGDSLHLLRDGTLKQITADHTFCCATPVGQRPHHPGRGAAVHPADRCPRALGDVDFHPEIDTTVPLSPPGDRWMRCALNALELRLRR